MERKIHRIDIIPAVFVKYREDGNVLLKCLQGDEYVLRAFEPYLFKNIPELKYLFLGIITDVGYMQLDICDGNEFEHLYKKHWKELL